MTNGYENILNEIFYMYMLFTGWSSGNFKKTTRKRKRGRNVKTKGETCQGKLPWFVKIYILEFTPCIVE